MPIIGLTDRAASFPLLGRIRKGDPKISANKPGADTNRFRLDAKGNEAIASAFTAAYGPTPERLPVMLPYATADENLSAWMEEWAAGGLKRRCDGVSISMEMDGDSYRPNPGACLRVMGGECGCKEAGKLAIVLPDLPFLGYFELVTSSKWDIIELSQNLAAIEAVTGTLRGVPLIVSRVEREISTPGFGANAGKRVRTTKSLLRLELEPRLQQRMMSGLRDAAIANFSPVSEEPALPAAAPEPKQIQLAPAPAPFVDGTAVNWAAYTDSTTGGLVPPTPSGDMSEESKFVLGYSDAAQNIAPTGRRAESPSYMAGRNWWNQSQQQP